MVAKLQLGERKLSTHFSKSSLQNKGAANPRVKTTGLIWMFTFTCLSLPRYLLPRQTSQFESHLIMGLGGWGTLAPFPVGGKGSVVSVASSIRVKRSQMSTLAVASFLSVTPCGLARSYELAQ